MKVRQGETCGRKRDCEARRRRRRGPPLAGLSGVVRMMNGRPAWAVRALMGAAELYITLLSVCERLLKALKSQPLRHSRPTSPGPDSHRHLRSQRPSDGRRPPQVGRRAAGRGEDGATVGWIVFSQRIM